MTANGFKGRLRFLKAFDAGLDCDDSAPEAYGAQNLGISEDGRENPTGMNIQRETAEGTEFRREPAFAGAWTKMQAMRRSAPAGSECADSRCPHAGSQMRAVGRAVFGCK